MKNRKYLTAIFLSGTLILSSCAKKINIEVPESREDERIILSRAFEEGEKNRNFASRRFTNPLDGKLSVNSAFGVRRPGNSIHEGVDFKAKIGTEVKAVNDGRVVLVARLSREGVIVIIDHGLNVFSLYMHMRDSSVKKGEAVKRSKVIGRSGDTGEGVTGPHLHFAVRLNGKYVDPALFMAIANIYLQQKN